MKRPDRYFEFLLGLLPASFRARHGDELGALLERMKDELGPSPSRLALLRFYLAATWDLLREFPKLRRDARDARGARPLEDLARNVQFASRSFGRSPPLTVTAILVLGLGIGANTAIFSAVRAVILQPRLRSIAAAVDPGLRLHDFAPLSQVGATMWLESAPLPPGSRPPSSPDPPRGWGTAFSRAPR